MVPALTTGRVHLLNLSGYPIAQVTLFGLRFFLDATEVEGVGVQIGVGDHADGGVLWEDAVLCDVVVVRLVVLVDGVAGGELLLKCFIIIKVMIFDMIGIIVD